jgi:hypothetical protein
LLVAFADHICIVFVLYIYIVYVSTQQDAPYKDKVCTFILMYASMFLHIQTSLHDNSISISVAVTVNTVLLSEQIVFV